MSSSRSWRSAATRPDNRGGASRRHWRRSRREQRRERIDRALPPRRDRYQCKPDGLLFEPLALSFLGMLGMLAMSGISGRLEISGFSVFLVDFL